jgi:hypothetical protein
MEKITHVYRFLFLFLEWVSQGGSEGCFDVLDRWLVEGKQEMHVEF